MIILDTNVVSETQKAHPNPLVMTYLDGCDPTRTYITAITVSEILYGIDILPVGKRKTELEDSAFKMFNDMFKGRILPFDFSAASHHAILAADARRAGKAVSLADGMIAGIARANVDPLLVTRDTTPFEAMRISVLNPWEEQQPVEWKFHDE